ncbi:MAG: transporter substrate-binding domain-containing protein [Eubacteriales bacterium]|nr:transporter substrate-binding domain-containing protein [Eubacteriales bacterium]
MKKGILKLAALSVAAVLSVGLMAGCGEGSDDKLVMGTNAAFEPFEFTTTEGLVGEFDGIDVAIALELAKSMDKELVIEDMEFDGLLASVQTGKIDMAVAGMTIKEERLKSVDFSIPYYTATQVMVVAADNTDIAKAEDLKNGKKVGVVLGYTGDSIVTDDLAIAEENITRANRGVDVVQDVKNGKLDAVVIDSYTGKALAEKNGLKVIEDAEAFEAEEYAIAVAKGNTELLDAINTKLEEMLTSGKIEEIAQQYN